MPVSRQKQIMQRVRALALLCPRLKIPSCFSALLVKKTFLNTCQGGSCNVAIMPLGKGVHVSLAVLKTRLAVFWRSRCETGFPFLCSGVNHSAYLTPQTQKQEHLAKSNWKASKISLHFLWESTLVSFKHSAAPFSTLQKMRFQQVSLLSRLVHFPLITIWQWLKHKFFKKKRVHTFGQTVIHSPSALVKILYRLTTMPWKSQIALPAYLSSEWCSQKQQAGLRT